jgi:type 1 fimbriae regulatory protein FimB/type 1 fimbriae regulatory protein FimE
MILVGYRHGLLAAELVSLELSQVDFATGIMHVGRVKQGSPSVHPIRGDELRPPEVQRDSAASPYVFVSERGAPFFILHHCRIRSSR